MAALLLLVVGFVVATLLVQESRAFSRRRVLSERADAFCGSIGEPANGLSHFAAVNLRLTASLDRLGLSTSDLYGRAYLGTSAVVLAVTLVFASWAMVSAVLTVLATGHFIFVRWRRYKRTQEFTDHLPAFLERVRRLVMIGNTLPQAFVETLATADPIIKRRLDPFIGRIQYGAAFPDCIAMLAQHNDIAELHMLAAYVKTNAKFGGRVTQTLTSLIDQLGNKRRLEREIKSATSETRASAAILVGLTAFLITFMAVMNPNFMTFYSGDEQGRLIFLCILVWPLLGAVLMHRILTLDF